jgi:hypothetical protein
MRRVVCGCSGSGKRPLFTKSHCLLAAPQNPRSPGAFGWTQRLQQRLPWLSPTSKTVSLVLRFSPIQQALNVAYARHDAVSGERLRPELEGRSAAGGG